MASVPLIGVDDASLDEFLHWRDREGHHVVGPCEVIVDDPVRLLVVEL